jgi:hypothetical protein
LSGFHSSSSSGEQPTNSNPNVRTTAANPKNPFWFVIVLSFFALSFGPKPLLLISSSFA